MTKKVFDLIINLRRKSYEIKIFIFKYYFFCFLSFFVIKSYAIVEIPNYSVNVDLALDYFNLYQIRAAQAIITDDGRFNNIYDTVNFNYLYNGGYDLEELKSDGYMTLVIEITAEVYEINDGYQYIFLYDDTTSNTYLRGSRFEHYPGQKSSTTKEYTFYFEVSLYNIQDNDFVIRYGASGNYDDDWSISNVRIQIGASYEAVKTSCGWMLQWLNENHTQYSYNELVNAW